jgi:glutathione peroxidase
MLSLTCVVLGAVLAKSEPVIPMQPTSFYDFTMPDIDGKDLSMKQFEGKVVLVVNVASKCGLTPQYAGLEELYQDFKDKGLVIVGFPANDFNGQEPGTNEEIKAFCTGNYNVTFPMMSKISVKGDGMSPLYKWLIENSSSKEDIEWNFAKFLIDKNGKVAYRFSPKITPESNSLRVAVENLLK